MNEWVSGVGWMILAVESVGTGVMEPVLEPLLASRITQSCVGIEPDNPCWEAATNRLKTVWCVIRNTIIRVNVRTNKDTIRQYTILYYSKSK